MTKIDALRTKRAKSVMKASEKRMLGSCHNFNKLMPRTTNKIKWNK